MAFTSNSVSGILGGPLWAVVCGGREAGLHSFKELRPQLCASQAILNLYYLLWREVTDMEQGRVSIGLDFHTAPPFEPVITTVP